MTSAKKEPENSAMDESEKTEDTKQDKGEVALDPNPSKALTELVIGSATPTPTDDSSSTDT